MNGLWQLPERKHYDNKTENNTETGGCHICTCRHSFNNTDKGNYICHIQRSSRNILVYIKRKVGGIMMNMNISKEDFRNIAEYANINWRGKFTPKETKEEAEDLYYDYVESRENSILPSIYSLMHNLIEDWSEGNDEVIKWLKPLVIELCLDLDWEDYTDTDPLFIKFIEEVILCQ